MVWSSTMVQFSTGTATGLLPFRSTIWALLRYWPWIVIDASRAPPKLTGFGVTEKICGGGSSEVTCSLRTIRLVRYAQLIGRKKGFGWLFRPVIAANVKL